MAHKTSLLAAGVVTSVAAIGLIGLPSASAQEGSFASGIASSLAERFNLSEAEVETFLDEQRDTFRAERQEARAEARAERLAELVEDGTLTQEQADTMTEMKEAMQAEKQELKDQDLSREEIREAMSELREEFQTWAEEEGIDLEEIRGDHDKKGRRGGSGFGQLDQESEETSDADISASVQEL